MSSKTVNEDLLIVTQGSKHLADTKTAKDVCWNKSRKSKAPYRNYIPTSACDDAEATQKTLIRGYRIVHSKSMIGTDYGKIPSNDDNFNGYGGGDKNGGVYFKHANDYPGDHSKNVKVEGNWIVRTDDETQQNKRNCTGKFREGGGGVTEDDLEALLNKGCTVESVTSKCGHRDTTTDRIGVLEGDKVTVTMVHVNDAEVDPAARKKPVCQVPRRKGEGKLPADAKAHPYFRVTRSAYPKTSWREAMPALTKELCGLTITLGVEWIGKAPPPKPDPPPNDWKEGVETNRDRKDMPEVTRDSYNQLGKVEGPPPLEGARTMRDLRDDDTHIPAQQARGRAEAQAALQRDMQLRQMREAMAQGTRDKVKEIQRREAEILDKGRGNTQSIKKLGEIGLNTWGAVKDLFYAKPIEVKVEAHACAGAKSVTIAAYPPSSYEVNLVDLKELKTAFQAIKDTIAKVRDFLKKIDGAGERQEGAGGDVTLTAGRFMVAVWFLKDSAAKLGIEYRELERDSAGKDEAPGRKKHEVFRAYKLDLEMERLVGIQFSYSIPLAYATGALGAFAQRLLDKMGADLNVKFEVELSVGVTGALEYDQYGKIIWARQGAIAPTAKFTISLNATSSSMSFSIGVTALWKPKVEIEPVKDQPLRITRKKSMVDIRWWVNAAVNIFGWTVDFDYNEVIWRGEIPEASYSLS